MLYNIEPQASPLIRKRLMEAYPQLREEDLPVAPVSEEAFVARLVEKTGDTEQHIRRVLHRIGVFATRRVPRKPLSEDDPSKEPSVGSGIPEDSGQSGTAGLSPGW